MYCGKMNREKIVDKSKLNGFDYRLFQETPAWELAKAVWDEDEDKIRKIVHQDTSLSNYQEPRMGSTLLMITIRRQEYKSFEILLKQRTDIYIRDTGGNTALMETCEYPSCNTKFLEKLIEYGANVNDVEFIAKNDPDKGKEETPLMLASTAGRLDFVRLLVKHGADINYQNEYGQSALSQAVIQEKYKVILFC